MRRVTKRAHKNEVHQKSMITAMLECKKSRKELRLQEGTNRMNEWLNEWANKSKCVQSVYLSVYACVSDRDGEGVNEEGHKGKVETEKQHRETEKKRKLWNKFIRRS